MPTGRSLSRKMYRWRSQVLPPNPASLTDIVIDCPIVLDDEGNSIVVGDDPGEADNERIILLSTKALMQAVPSAVRGCADATFNCAPKFLAILSRKVLFIQ